LTASIHPSIASIHPSIHPSIPRTDHIHSSILHTHRIPSHTRMGMAGTRHMGDIIASHTFMPCSEALLISLHVKHAHCMPSMDGWMGRLPGTANACMHAHALHTHVPACDKPMHACRAWMDGHGVALHVVACNACM
jgi:hypothetical protein